MVRHLGPLPSVFLTQAAHQPADVVHHSSPVVSGISLTAAVPREQPGQGRGVSEGMASRFSQALRSCSCRKRISLWGKCKHISFQHFSLHNKEKK